VDVGYFVGLTPLEKLSEVKLGSPEMNSDGERRDT